MDVKGAKALRERIARLRHPKASDRLMVTHQGRCPHCGETDPTQFFDNDEDEFAWCYTCRNHSTNPRWRARLSLVPR